jgi:hypothetical protein
MPGENIFEFQNSGHLAGNVVTFLLDEHGYRRFSFNANYHHMNFKANAHDGVGPQSTYSNSGESARVDWLRHNGFSLLGNWNLPMKLDLSAQFDTENGAPYNITTGTDNNGDGSFNDRPAYAPATEQGAGVYSTRFGLLTSNTVNGNVPRNLGTMPALVHLDGNLSRAFALHGGDKDHSRTLTVNVRSANVLNHTNVTGVQTVLSSTLGQPIAAETARRVEVGLRFAF